MKKSIYILVFGYFSCIGNDIVISKFCEHVHQRMYYISRLSKLIHYLESEKKLYQELELKLECEKITNKRVVSALFEIKTMGSIEPLFKLWKEVLEYKHLEEKGFFKDFSLLVLMVHKKITSLKTKSKSVPDPELIFTLPDTNFTEAITLRKYHCRRLSKAFKIIPKINCSQEMMFERKNDSCDCTLVSTTYDFKHKNILQCIESVNEKKTLKPLITLIDEFNRYKLIQDRLYNKEFLLLIFSSYRNILINNAQLYRIPIKKTILESIAFIHDNLEHLPMEQVLDAIDILIDELPQIVEHYELNSDISWKKWLKKYWWVPPIVGGGLFVKIWLTVNTDSHEAPTPSIRHSRPLTPSGSDDNLHRESSHGLAPKKASGLGMSPIVRARLNKHSRTSSAPDITITPHSNTEKND